MNRVGVVTVLDVGTDAGLQFCQNGKVDTDQLLFNTVGRVTIGTTSEVTRNLAKRTSHNKKLNKNLTDDVIVGVDEKTKELKKKVMKAAENLNSLSPDVVEENKKQVLEQEKKIQNRQNEVEALKTEINQVDGDLKKTRKSIKTLEQDKKNDNYVFTDITHDHTYENCRNTSKPLTDDNNILNPERIFCFVEEDEEGQ